MKRHPGIEFEKLRSASIFEARHGGEPVGDSFEVAQFGRIPLRGARARGMLYLPELKLQVLAGDVVPLEAVQDQWSLGFELDRKFQGKVDSYRSAFEFACSDQDVCVLANFYSRNFFHWITEELVKVSILEHSGFSGSYVVTGLPEFAAGFLVLLGIPNERIIRSLKGPTWFKSSVYTTAITARQLDAHPELFLTLRDALLGSAPQSANSSPRRLWMDRNLGVNNVGRGLVNAQEVYSILDRYGFEVVDFAALSVAGQIALANSADVLSGSHGAGFIHTMFMRPRSQVIECYSPLFINPGVFEVCRLLRHRYFMIVHENCFSGYPHGHGLMVSCSHLELTLQSLD